jgi:hypothetical protein
MALTQEEAKDLHREMLHQLFRTPYACNSLQPLGGGTANFLFRACLSQALPNGSKSVVVKHSKGFVPGNRNFELDVSRVVCSLHRSNLSLCLVGAYELKYTDGCLEV